MQGVLYQPCDYMVPYKKKNVNIFLIFVIVKTIQYYYLYFIQYFIIKTINNRINMLTFIWYHDTIKTVKEYTLITTNKLLLQIKEKRGKQLWQKN